MAKITVTAEEALAYHLEPSPGKYKIVASKPLKDAARLIVGLQPRCGLPGSCHRKKP